VSITTQRHNEEIGKPDFSARLDLKRKFALDHFAKGA